MVYHNSNLGFTGLLGRLSISCRVTLFFKCFSWAKNDTISTGRLTQPSSSGGETPEWGILKSVFPTNSKTDLLFDLGKLLDALEPQDPWLYDIPFSDDTQDYHKDQMKSMKGEKGESHLKHANCYGITACHCYSQSNSLCSYIPYGRYLHPFSFSLLQWNFRKFCHTRLPPWSCAFLISPPYLSLLFPTFLQGYAWLTRLLKWNPFMMSSVTASPWLNFSNMAAIWPVICHLA